MSENFISTLNLHNTSLTLLLPIYNKYNYYILTYTVLIIEYKNTKNIIHTNKHIRKNIFFYFIHEKNVTQNNSDASQSYYKY